MGKKPAEKEAKKTVKIEKKIKKEKRVVKAHHKKEERPLVCKVNGCKRPYKAKGYCKVHYKKWRHGQYGKMRYKCCKEDGCFKPMALNKHGYCEKHYEDFYVKGVTIEAPQPKEEVKEKKTA